MPTLTTTIEKAAQDFAATILAAVKDASLQELLALQVSAPTPRRGRPPTTKKRAGRKPGRPPKGGKKTSAKVVAQKSTAPAKKKKRKINFPKCSVPGCGKNRYARGNGMCGEHFKAAKAGA